MSLIVGIPQERLAGERRVAIEASVIQKLAKLGVQVAIEAGAGQQPGRAGRVRGQPAGWAADKGRLGAGPGRCQVIFTTMSCRVLAQLAMRSAALERWR